MTDRPILFSGPMVRALLAGTKTQTRRTLGQFDVFRLSDGSEAPVSCLQIEGQPLPRVTIGRVVTERQLKAAVGDRLWVRETWQGLSFGDYQPTKSSQCEVRYAATDPCADLDAESRGYSWRPSIFMPRWASRITLTVTDIRVERLQDCSDSDAIAEGIERSKDFPDRFMTPDGDYAVPAVAYQRLWESINGPGSWDANPWIAAYTFTVQRGNIDQIARAA
ncbi:hypothetical protein ELI30_08850 [Rhizobium leguminosarum]|uniref:hypothetical protein n=1 Tax=Rhizobium leguminosarum TaxID=384 RepID=UPI001030093E|nr:hypothetical protein [Rhizobium leguminosarum]TAV48401.1 hypothetical protein ELI32_09305 [Rhizobium leguminosarum]TAV57901.1 hypothetical protein ELI31_08835 [Rhizobium leguminosarum]TAV68841.1 hypothetical protein ELI30_08850 [Rhizobium leguminosarum]